MNEAALSTQQLGRRQGRLPRYEVRLILSVWHRWTNDRPSAQIFGFARSQGADRVCDAIDLAASAGDLTAEAVEDILDRLGRAAAKRRAR
jgi:hypothetical protein